MFVLTRRDSTEETVLGEAACSGSSEELESASGFDEEARETSSPRGGKSSFINIILSLDFFFNGFPTSCLSYESSGLLAPSIVTRRTHVLIELIFSVCVISVIG